MYRYLTNHTHGLKTYIQIEINNSSPVMANDMSVPGK